MNNLKKESRLVLDGFCKNLKQIAVVIEIHEYSMFPQAVDILFEIQLGTGDTLFQNFIVGIGNRQKFYSSGIELFRATVNLLQIQLQ